jgi:hypothetical protein
MIIPWSFILTSKENLYTVFVVVKNILVTKVSITKDKIIWIVIISDDFISFRKHFGEENGNTTKRVSES